MKLIYLTNNRIPSEKANSLQIMQSCASFVRNGVELTLAVPRRAQPAEMRGVGDPFEYYGLKDRFPIRRLPCVDLLEVAPGPFQPGAFALQSASFAAAAAPYLLARHEGWCYTRDPLVALLVAFTPQAIRRRTAFEAHTFPKQGPKRALHLWAVNRLASLVCITRGLAGEYHGRGVSAERIVVAPDAVDLERFDHLPDRAAARLSLGIPATAKIACYTGHLYEWKGAHTLAIASSYLRDGYLVYIVGGTREDAVAFRRFLREHGLEKVRAIGHVAPDRVPSYLAAADVLVLPNSGKSETSARHTSPMKLFEYMAAGRPIVASRLPSLQEVLRDEENALLADPDDPESLAKAIVRAGTDDGLSARLAGVAQEEVRGYSWDARAKIILDHLEMRS